MTLGIQAYSHEWSSKFGFCLSSTILVGLFPLLTFVGIFPFCTRLRCFMLQFLAGLAGSSILGYYSLDVWFPVLNGKGMSEGDVDLPFYTDVQAGLWVIFGLLLVLLFLSWAIIRDREQ